MKIQKNAVVTINYKLTNLNGDVLDSTHDKGPLSYIQGVGFLTPSVEERLEGNLVGETLRFTVTPEEGYGHRDDELVQTLDKSQFENPSELEIGLEFEADTEYGPIVVFVVDMDDDTVTVDGNHTLAGETLIFDINILDVRDATEEELESGQVISPQIIPN